MRFFEKEKLPVTDVTGSVERRFSDGSCHASGTKEQDEPDDRRADRCRKSEAHHEHAIPLEVAFERKRHLDESIDDEHLECQSLRFSRTHEPHELGQHRDDVHEAEEPDDSRPPDLICDLISRHSALLIEDGPLS